MSIESKYVNLESSSDASLSIQTCADAIELFDLPMFNVPHLHQELVEKVTEDRTLKEMGFSIEDEHWSSMDQPKKKNLYVMVKNKIFQRAMPDLKIRIGARFFNCHMAVLQCFSELFMGFDNEKEIELCDTEITPGGFSMAYNWMLNDESKVQRKKLLEIFRAAYYLRIHALINQCWSCLESKNCFHEETAFMLFLETQQYEDKNMKDLRLLMLSRISNFFLTLVACKEFFSLTKEELCLLIGSQMISVNTEIEVFLSAVRWLSHDWDERKMHLMDVIKCVRFGLMPPLYLTMLFRGPIESEDISRIVIVPEIQKMIIDATTYIALRMKFNANETEEFNKFIKNFGMDPFTQRRWVFDKDCSYHHYPDCTNVQIITYQLFNTYLNSIRTGPANKWKSLLVANDENDELKPCCQVYDDTTSSASTD